MDHPGVRSDKQRAVDAVPAWFHSFDFGDGVQAFGYVSLEALRYRATLMPDVRGKSVLDINTFDGADAFGCEQRGAARVVAMDYFCWAMDLGHHFRVYREDRARGLSPAPPREMPYWRPDTMPGKIGFDTAHRLLESRVEPLVADFATMPEGDLAKLGQFDVVLFLGSLYHMADPLGALRRVHRVTAPGGIAVIETQAMVVRDHDTPLAEVYGPTHILNHDRTNCWAPNIAALREWCLNAGFSTVEVILGPPSYIGRRRERLYRFMPVAKRLLPPRQPAIAHYRALVYARP